MRIISELPAHASHLFWSHTRWLCSCSYWSHLLQRSDACVRWHTVGSTGTSQRTKTLKLLLLTSLGISSSWDVWEFESIPDEEKTQETTALNWDIRYIWIFTVFIYPLVSEAPTSRHHRMLEKLFSSGVTARYSKAVTVISILMDWCLTQHSFFSFSQSSDSVEHIISSNSFALRPGDVRRLWSLFSSFLTDTSP